MAIARKKGNSKSKVGIGTRGRQNAANRLLARSEGIVEQAWVLPGKRSKYGNRKVQADGYVFDSQREYARYCELKLLLRGGTITDLEVHPVFDLQPKFTDASGKKHRALQYEADFAYTDGNQRVVIDVKGVETAVFKLKWKLLLYQYRDRPEYVFGIEK